MISAKGTREEMNMETGHHHGLRCFFQRRIFQAINISDISL